MSPLPFLILILLLLALSEAEGQEIHQLDPYERRFDLRIQLATARHWRPHYDRPDAWKAQLLAESGLNPAAVSPVGARGLAQFMPQTFIAEKRRQGATLMSPHDIAAIDLGAGYMASIRRLFLTAGLRDEEERQRHARAGYNSGPGNTLKAMRRCDARAWEHTAICYPGVTGRHAAETIGYVARIDRTIEEINGRVKRAGRAIRPIRRP